MIFVGYIDSKGKDFTLNLPQWHNLWESLRPVYRIADIESDYHELESRLHRRRRQPTYVVNGLNT